MSDLPVALVGHGYWGSNLARNLHSAAGVCLVAVADAGDERRELAAHLYPGVEVYESLQEVLDNDLVRAVVLATPVATHADLALRVLDAGRHVFVEKPLATTTADAVSITGRGP